MKKEFKKSITKEQWQELANLTGLSASEFKKRYLEAVENYVPTPNPPAVEYGKLKKDNDGCDQQDFNINLGIAAITGTVRACRNQTGWRIEITACIEVAGVKVLCRSFVLDQNNLKHCFDVSLVVARGRICFGARGSKVCLFVEGELCVWVPIEWHCAKFDETILCLL